MATTAALTSGLVVSVPNASADQISNLRAEAAALSARITALGNQEEALSERYDQAVSQVQSLQQQVTAAQAHLAAAQKTTNGARAALESDAIQAYVNGGNNPLTASVQGASQSLLADEYINTLVTNQSDDLDQYRLDVLQEQAAGTQLRHQEAAAKAQLDQLNSDRNAVASASAQLTATESQVKGQIGTLVAQQQAAAEAAAQAAAAAAAQQRAQAAAAAAQLTNSTSSGLGASGGGSGGGGGVTVNYSPPPPGSGASGAVAAAESRIGDWYSWGAAGPNTFDCSGLVMWAYAQVGISLPHFSGAQYNDTTHIPMSDLQPGDLVFFSDPGEHVAMYVGGGDIIEAAHTGTQVHIVPMYAGFTLASRVA